MDPNLKLFLLCWIRIPYLIISELDRRWCANFWINLNFLRSLVKVFFERCDWNNSSANCLQRSFYLYRLPTLWVLRKYISQCCGSGMFPPGSRILILTHPGSRVSDLDPKTAKKESGEKKFVIIPFYVATNFTKFKIILVLKCLRKKFGPIVKELHNFLPKKLSLSSKIWVWDPGSEIRDPEKTYSGSRIQGSKRHRIPDPDPQHWY